MKKIFRNILLTGLAVLSLGSCKKEFLDTVKIGEPAEDGFYSNDEDLVTASNSLYSAMWEYHYNWGRSILGTFTSDDAIHREANYAQFDDYSFNSTHFFFLYNWRYNYRGILIANKLISNVEGVDIAGVKNKDLQKRVVAEAKFMRAYYYFDLVTKYGGVPKIDKPLLEDDFIQERASTSEIYSFIEEDLNAALADLPLKSEMVAAHQEGRATKGAALALLTKVAVTQASPGYAGQDFYNDAKWTEAKQHAEALFALGEYSLYTGDYHDIFSEDGENGPGSIFEVQFYDSPLDDGAFTNNGNFSSFLFMPWFGGGDPYGGHQVTYDLYLAFEDGDPRREASIINTLEYADQWILTDETPGVVSEDKTGLANYKHYMTKEQYKSLGNTRNSPINERILRLSDVYLMYAEACLNTGDAATALTYINNVRERARGTGAVPADLTSVTLDDIYNERRVELCSEGHRWLDLIRTGKQEQELKTDGFLTKAAVARVDDGAGNITYTVSDAGEPIFKVNNLNATTHMFYPVPQTEIDNTDGVVTQNSGY